MTKNSSRKVGAKATQSASTAVDAATQPEAVFSGFSAVADGYIAAAVATSTKRIYAADQRHFTANGIVVPATPAQVVEYLAKFAGQLAVATLNRRLNYLHKLHAEKNLPSPTSDTAVRLAMRGIRRTIGTKQRRVIPLLKDDILEVLYASDRQKPMKAARDRAIISLGFCGAFRRSELVGIRVEHIVRVEAGIEIELPTSKTDTDGNGRVVFIPFAHSERCPVRALDKWLAIARIESGAVFRQVTRHDYVSGTGLTPHAVALILKSAVARAGGDPTDVSGHSLRSGFCTQAAMSDIPNWMVRQITGHTSDAMLNVYCRPVKRRKIPSLL